MSEISVKKPKQTSPIKVYESKLSITPSRDFHNSSRMTDKSAQPLRSSAYVNTRSCFKGVIRHLDPALTIKGRKQLKDDLTFQGRNFNLKTACKEKLSWKL